MVVVALVLVRVTMIVAVVVPVLVLILVTAAMIAFAQLVDVISTYSRLGHFINDVAPGMVVVRAVHMSRIGSGPQHGTANRRMRAGITTKAADSRIHDKARDQRDQRLRGEQHRHGLHGYLLGEQQRQHLVGGREKHRHQGAQRHDATGVQCGPPLPKKPHCGTMPSNEPTTGPAAPARLMAPLTRSPADVLQGLEGQIRHQQKRHQRERVLAGVEQNINQQIHDGWNLSCLSAAL